MFHVETSTPVTISHVLGLDPWSLRPFGTVNIRVDKDNPFYIDPRLLRRARTPELRGAAEDVDERFDQILLLLSKSKRRGDPYWKRAELLTRFKEPPGLCLGWGEKSTRGRGIGTVLRKEILDAAKDSMTLGTQDVRLFEFLIVLDSGISHDRISDMLGSIIFARLLRYNQRIYNSLGVPGTPFPWGEDSFDLPIHPETRHPLVLVPKEILALLPKGKQHSEIVKIVEEVDALRNHFNQTLGKHWKSRVDAGILRREVLAHKELLEPALESYRQARPKPYNFNKDPRELYKPINDALALVHAAPLKLPEDGVTSADAAMTIVLGICEGFRRSIEDQGFATLLIHEGKGRPEKDVQKVFHLVAQEHCRANKLDLSPETNAGRGSVDFKMSQGSDAKVLVEIKLARNKDLEHGYSVQLAEYGKAEQTSKRIFLIVDYGDDEAATARASNLRARATPEFPIVLVRAMSKKAASKFNPEPTVTSPDIIMASTQDSDGNHVQPVEVTAPEANAPPASPK